MKRLSEIRKHPATKVGLFSLLTLIFLFPTPYLPVPELDASWQVVLEKAFFERWEFGKTVNFTGGPLSFLYTPTSIGYYPHGQLAMEALLLLAGLALIFSALRDQSFWISVLAFSGLFFGSVVGKDGIYLASIAATGFLLLREKPGWWAYLLIGYLVIISMVKFSFATLSLGCLAVLVAGRLLQRDSVRALKWTGSYGGLFILLWWLIGQRPGNLPGYFVHSWHISRGYLQNMQLHETPGQFFLLVYLGLLVAVPVLWICLRKKNDRLHWLSFALLGCTLFLAWKAGITRAGSHLSIFLIAAYSTALMCLPMIKYRKAVISWGTTLMISFTLGFHFLYPGGWREIGSLTPRFVATHIRYLTSAQMVSQSFTQLIPVVKQQNALPVLDAVVGSETVDVLQYQQAITLLNDWNYHPRPTVQNYHGFNSHLLLLNQEHIKQRPPDYILSKFLLMDARYPLSDDSLYNREVLVRYEPVLSEGDYLLLKKRNAPRIWESKGLVIERPVRALEEIDVSHFPNDILWLKVDYRPSLFHRLAAFFYKPEILRIHLQLENGERKSFRLPAGVLDTGFMLNPLLENNGDLERFLHGYQAGSAIRSFSIESSPGLTPFATREFGIRLERIQVRDGFADPGARL